MIEMKPTFVTIDRHPGRSAQTIGVARALGTDPDLIHEPSVGVVGTKGDSNRTAFTSVYNFVAGYYNKQHAFLRPEATTIVVFFMDEEETRMAVWEEQRDGTRNAQWIENGTLPALLDQYNARHPAARQTLDGYINYWVMRPFIIAKGNRRGKLEMHAVVSPGNISHRPRRRADRWHGAEHRKRFLRAARRPGRPHRRDRGGGARPRRGQRHPLSEEHPRSGRRPGGKPRSE